MGASYKLTKYCSNKDYAYKGLADYRTSLVAMDDAATANLGKRWRMPTDSELSELVRRCKKSWTKVNGIYGICVTGPNGNSIFFPASGLISYLDGTLTSVGSNGYCWASTVYHSFNANSFSFDSKDWSTDFNDRAYAFPIRPVLAE